MRDCKQYQNPDDCPAIKKLSNLCPSCRKEEEGQGLCSYSLREDNICPFIFEGTYETWKTI